MTPGQKVDFTVHGGAPERLSLLARTAEPASSRSLTVSIETFVQSWKLRPGFSVQYQSCRSTPADVPARRVEHSPSMKFSSTLSVV